MNSRSLWTGCLVTFVAVLFFLGISGVVLALLGKGSIFSSQERVGVVEIKGLLTDSRTAIKQLDRYRDDDSIKAIVLRINSQGGAVGPAQAAGAFDGVSEVAELVHQTRLFGFLAGIDPAFRQGFHLGQGNLAVVGHVA